MLLRIFAGSLGGGRVLKSWARAPREHMQSHAAHTHIAAISGLLAVVVLHDHVMCTSLSHALYVRRARRHVLHRIYRATWNAAVGRKVSGVSDSPCLWMPAL